MEPMSLAPGAKLGAYEIVASIGAGGMGEVYRARDAKLDRDVAVKVLPSNLSQDSTALARFEREAKAVAALSHPGILAIFDFGSADGVSYAVTELLQGETLRDRLAEGPLPARKALEYAVQVAEALAAAHDKGIVHRDLKPANLFVTTGGRVKILDFGLAVSRALPADGATQSVSPHDTTPGTILGTVGYMSPEQARGLPAGPGSDIFSFGAVLYEMLSGRRAFQRDSVAETLHAVLKEDPPDLVEASQGLAPALERIVRRCLEKRPEHRFQSAHDLAFALEGLGSPTGISRTVSMPPASRFAGSRALGPAALLVAGIAVGVLGDRLLRSPRPVQPPVYRRLTVDRGTVGRARFAPDGNTVVYNAAWRGEETQVFATLIDSHNPRPLGLTGALLHAVSSASELLVGLEAGGPMTGTAMLGRVPLAGGAPRQVLADVTWADWSPDGRELAVARVVDEADRVEFPLGKVIDRDPGTVTHLRISPSGDRVAFIRHPPASPYSAGSLVVVDREGAKRTLSSGWADAFGLAWRPDGLEVWFTAGRRDEFKALRAVTLAGEERIVARMLGQVDLQDIARDGRVLLTHPTVSVEIHAGAMGESRDRDLTWLGLSDLGDISGDGKQLLFTEHPEGAGEGGSTFLRGTDGSPAVRLGEGVAVALSPGGEWALSVITSPPRLVLLPTGAGEVRELTRPGMAYLPAGGFFPDGRRVVFLAEVGGVHRAYVQDIEKGEPRPFGPEGLERPVVSPDGLTLVALAADGRPSLYALGGGEPRPLRGLEPGDPAIRWSPDGRALFFSRTRGLVTQIHRQDLATGETRLVREFAPLDVAGADAPNVSVTPDGKSFAYSHYRSLSELYLVEGLK
jgi:hypothetical protein